MNKEHKAVNEVRSMAVKIVHDVMENGAYANLALEKYLKNISLSSADKNLITEIVNGTVRMVKHLDWVLDIFLLGSIKKQNPWLRNVLRISLYQLLFMDRIPDYACINDAVEIARQKAGAKLARVCNGVLRNISRNRDKIEYPQKDKIEYLAVYYSHPEWLVQLWVSSYGYEQTEKLLLHNNRRPEVMLRCNNLKFKRDELAKQLADEGISSQVSTFTPWGIAVGDSGKAIPKIEAFQQGCFYVQNEASMLAAPILNPLKGAVVLDLCCGIGGKSTHLAEYMNNQGRVCSFDIYEQKLGLLKQNYARLGISIIEAYQGNIMELDSTKFKSNYVLLDAPCSGLGVLNRRADSRWRKNTSEIAELEKLQAQMIRKAATMVAENGSLLYSTCTINHSENEEIVFSFLQEHSDFLLENFAQQIDFVPLDDEDRAGAQRGMLTIMPGKYKTDGMYYALLRRKNFS